jgi:2,4-dienoyl-CoA reductase-like NADH-dependent reductase (Old Yellow Enzyme family)
MKNRLVLAPMTTYSSNNDLTLSLEEEVYYNSRSKNIGMVITAAVAVSKDAQAFENQISIKDDSFIPSMKRLSEAIKKEGAIAVIQLHHGGRMNSPSLYDDQDIVGPSAIKAERETAVVPRELSNQEVYQTIDDFVQATKRAIIAGFDGVELHGANTYLLQQFFSPHSNQRNDEFGGTLKNRLLFANLLVKEVINLKNEMNVPKFIVGYRLSPEEIENPGITLEDSTSLIDMLTTLEIDYIHLSTSKYNQSSMRDKNDKEPIFHVLKKAINNNIPLIGVGGIKNSDDLTKALELGYDAVALGSITLGDVNAAYNILHNKKIGKVINRDSLLPTPLYNRIKAWFTNTDEFKVE